MTEDLKKKKILRLLKKIVWDYNTNMEDLYAVIFGKKEKAGHFDFERIFVRMLERLPWYDLLFIFDTDFLCENLTGQRLRKLRFPELRSKYEYVRKVLQKQPVPLSGWDTESRERVKHTLLSNRWYSTEPSLF